MRLIKLLVPLFLGSTTHQVDDPPFEVDDRTAAELVKRRQAEYVAAVHLPPERGPAPETTTDPAPGRAEQAVAPRQAKHGRQS
jgi:hypothetical protein